MDVARRQALSCRKADTGQARERPAMQNARLPLYRDAEQGADAASGARMMIAATCRLFAIQPARQRQFPGFQTVGRGEVSAVVCGRTGVHDRRVATLIYRNIEPCQTIRRNESGEMIGGQCGGHRQVRQGHAQ